jgi:hypothetical protein
MKYSLTLLMAITLIFSACKKDKPEQVPTAAGYWKGSENTTLGTNYTNAFVLNADGTLKYYYNYNVDTATATFKSAGKYELVNNKFKAIIYLSNLSTMISYTYEGAINSGLTKVENGTWGYGNKTTGGGEFYIDKQ